MGSESNRWVECSVAELAADKRNAIVGGPFGSDLVSRDYTPTGVPVIRGQNLSWGGRSVGGDFVFVSEEKADSLSANLANSGDIVFTQRGNAVLQGGQVAIVPNCEYDRYVISQSQMKLSPNPDFADTLFLYYVFRSPSHVRYLRNNAIVTGVPHTNLGILREYRLLLPPIKEQKAIAHILGTLDDKIELNRRMNGTLESMARALFKSWFVDFDPVIDNALAAGHSIPDPLAARASARRALGPQRKPLPENIRSLFPASFTFNEEMGWIPDGWSSQPLSSIADIVMGTSPKSSTYNGEGEGTALVNGPVEFGAYFPVKRKWTTAPTRFSESNDLIFCVRGSTTGRRIHSDGVYCLGRGVCAMRSKNNHQAFVNQTIESELPRMLSGVTGSVFPNLNGPDLKGFPIVVPCESLLSEFSAIVNESQEKLASNVSETATLTKLRDTLLPKLLSGELRIPEAEKLVADSV